MCQISDRFDHVCLSLSAQSLLDIQTHTQTQTDTQTNRHTETHRDTQRHTDTDTDTDTHTHAHTLSDSSSTEVEKHSFVKGSVQVFAILFF